jgi:DNA-directed RNA polymerase sigma subunit (sigma70/sigma32)
MNNELTNQLSVIHETLTRYFKYRAEKGALILTEACRKGYFNAPASDNPEAAALSAGLAKVINEALDSLSAREQRIIAAHFFTDPEYDHRLYRNWFEYYGQKIGLTGERVRQIEAKGLRKLRHPTRSEKLKTYYYRDDDEWL